MKKQDWEEERVYFGDTPHDPACRLIPIDLIDMDPEFAHPVALSDEDEHALRFSLDEFGILLPLTVTRQDGRFLLIDGYRRLPIAKELGWDDVSCQVYPDSDRKKLLLIRDEINGTELSEIYA